MARRSLLRAAGPLLLLGFGGAYAIASFDWCGKRPVGSPTLVTGRTGAGPLLAGASKVAVAPPWPVARAGFGPWKPKVGGTVMPLHARALILEQGDLRIGVVSLEILLIPAALRQRILDGLAELELGELVVLATHTHSSLGGYDGRWISQLGGTGRFREDVERAVAEAAISALREAARARVEVSVHGATGTAAELVYSRVGDMAADAELTRLQLRAVDRPVAEWLVVSAHPTFWSEEELSPDYPGFLSDRFEKEGGPVTLVSMGAVGNGSAHGEAAEPYAQALAERMGSLVPTPSQGALAIARAETLLPRPDSSRLVPSFFRRAGDNFLCASAPTRASVTLLELGGLRLALLPGEITEEAATELRAAVRADRVLSLADDYLGYIESPGRLQDGTGESRRQFFSAELARALRTAGEHASQALAR